MAAVVESCRVGIVTLGLFIVAGIRFTPAIERMAVLDLTVQAGSPNFAEPEGMVELREAATVQICLVQHMPGG